jgi:hypothetical protein
MKRQDDINYEFQNIHNVNELSKIINKKNTYYKGIKISFLKALLGEDWTDLFDKGWGTRKEFMKDYKVEYAEWNEFEE